MNAKQIWQTTIERLQTRVPSSVFTTWFKGTAALSFQEHVFVVGVPSTFAKAQMEVRFNDLVRTVLAEVTGGSVEVRFVVAKAQPAYGEQEEAQNGAANDGAAVVLNRRTYRAPKRRSGLRNKPDASQLAPLHAAPTSEPAPAIAMNSNAPAVARPVAHRAGETSQPVAPPPPQPSRPPAPRVRSNAQEYLPLESASAMNPRYTFDAFIVGKSNQLAHAASLAVADNPGHIYNPLFFYGGVGLGKTHLLHAIGHTGEIAGLNVLYTTSEKFTNEIINAIRYQKTADFRAKYRQIDILLVDDIQFIAGKESTEEEFFHTFNALYDANKQIVVTSDRPPKAIHSLQDRLRSRFEWGLLADVQAPDYEHRQAILRSKAESLRFPIPAGVIDCIARPQCSSVRELEGALNRVIAFATLHDAPLTVGLATEALKHIYSDTKPSSNAHLTVNQVLEGVCRFYNADPERIRGKGRDREITWPRQVAMYVMREETDASLLQIGTELGGRDHTTIMYGWEKVQSEITNNDRVRREIAAVLEAIEQGR